MNPMPRRLKEGYVSLTKERRLYGLEKPIVGLTGGVATGKTTVAGILDDLGVCVICADGLVRKIYEKKETLDFLMEHFPACIEGNRIDFQRLRQSVFGNRENLAKVEDFIYTFVPDEFLKMQQEATEHHFLVYDVPLLFEKNLDDKVDLTICVYAQESFQKKRLFQRDGIDDILIETMLSCQLSIEEKKTLADIVVDNTSSLKELHRRVVDIFDILME